MQRRGFLAGILAAGMAPAFVGAKVLMPVRRVIVPTAGLLTMEEMTREAMRIFTLNMQFIASVNTDFDNRWRAEGDARILVRKRGLAQIHA